MNRLKSFIRQKTLAGEIVRFIFVGGIATVVDFLTMAVVLYVSEPAEYETFWQVFFVGGDDRVVNLIGTGLGFFIGVIVNYVLSVAFVFNRSEGMRSVKGFVEFTALSFVGLLLHELGMWGLNLKLGINEWLVKIVMTAVVLCYNFVTRRLLLFNSGKAARSGVAMSVANKDSDDLADQNDKTDEEV